MEGGVEEEEGVRIRHDVGQEAKGGSGARKKRVCREGERGRVHETCRSRRWKGFAAGGGGERLEHEIHTTVKKYVSCCSQVVLTTINIFVNL